MKLASKQSAPPVLFTDHSGDKDSGRDLLNPVSAFYSDCSAVTSMGLRVSFLLLQDPAQLHIPLPLHNSGVDIISLSLCQLPNYKIRILPLLHSTVKINTIKYYEADLMGVMALKYLKSTELCRPSKSAVNFQFQEQSQSWL